MKFILSILIFLMSCLFGSMSICNLITLLIFDTHFICKLFRTIFVHSKFSMICSFFISLFLHAAILVGGYFISVHFHMEGFYIVPLAYILFKSIRQGRFRKRNMLTLFFQKHNHNISPSLSLLFDYNESGLIENHEEIIKFINSFARF